MFTSSHQKSSSSISPLPMIITTFTFTHHLLPLSHTICLHHPLFLDHLRYPFITHTIYLHHPLSLDHLHYPFITHIYYQSPLSIIINHYHHLLPLLTIQLWHVVSTTTFTIIIYVYYQLLLFTITNHHIVTYYHLPPSLPTLFTIIIMIYNQQFTYTAFITTKPIVHHY